MNQAKRILPCLLLLFIALFLTVVQSVSAQQDEPAAGAISLVAEAGFEGYYKSQFWLPVQVTAANSGPAVEGEIRVVVDNSVTSDPLVYNTPISLPTQSNKRVTLLLNVANSGVPAYAVELLDEDGTVVARTLTNNLRMEAFDNLLYGVVSTDAGELDFLENVRGGRSDAAVAFLDIEDLPPVAAAWNALDIVLFNDVDTGQLTAEQLQALQSWVSTGGQLIVSGGPGWQKTAAAFGDMLPVTLSGSESAADLPALSSALGFPFRDPGPYLLAASSLRSGELLYHQDGLPLLASHRWGRGTVYFLALDPKLAPLLDWDGTEVLFNTIASSTPTLPPWSAGVQGSYQAGEAVASLPSLALPSAFQLILFLLIYIVVIGPANYVFLKRTGRRELAWVTIPALVVLFTVTAYIAGFQLKGNNTIINQLNIAFGQVGSEQMRIQSLIGLYSPRRATYDLTFPADVAARPFDPNFGSMGGSGNLDAVTRSNELVMSNVLVDVSGVQAFLADSYRPAPAISAEARMSISGNLVEVHITARNEGDVELETATVLVGPSIFLLGDLEPGDSVSNSFTLSRSSLASSATAALRPYSGGSVLTDNAATIIGTSNYYDDPVAYPRWQLLMALDERYYSTGLPVGMVPDDVATIIGWSDEAQLDLRVDRDDFDSLSTTLYFLEVPLERDLVQGSQIQVPAALLNWEVVSSGGAFSEPSISNFYLGESSWMEFEYTPWPEFAQMDVTGLDIRLLDASGSNSVVPAIRLWDWQQEGLVDVEGVNWGSTAVPDFQRFIGPNNAVRLQIRNDSVPAGMSISEIYPVLTGDLE